MSVSYTPRAEDVKTLRQRTGGGINDCRNALIESSGDFEQAVDILRSRGQAQAAKRAGVEAREGVVQSYIHAGNKIGVLVEVDCETDFVAKGDKFVVVADALAAHVAKTSPADLEAALASEINPGQTVQQFVDEANATLGEKIVFRRFAQFTGNFVSAYMHRTDPDLPPAIGVLVELDSANAEIAKDVAQHIAAFAPTYLSREEIPAEALENERRIAEATAREEGKPEAALERIVEGRVTGFVKENAVLEQAFAKDNKKTVQKVLDEAGVKLVRFARFRVGA